MTKIATTSHRTDSEIQQDVLRELKWDMRVKETEVGVEVDHGVVTLTGTIASYAKKMAAREAAHRVAGVLDVADNLEVRIPGISMRSDTELAQAVRRALEWDVFLPDARIRSTVSNGWVNLEGEVDSLVDQLDAELCVQRLHGVRGVINNIKVLAPKADASAIRDAIEATLERRADREADRIDVKVADGKVTLEGRVHSWPEKQAVFGAVSHAAGVRSVNDHLRIEPYF